MWRRDHFVTGIRKQQTEYPGTSVGLPPASHTHPESDVTSLVTDLGHKAPLASPTFTGTVGGITAAMVGAQPVDSNLTAIAGLPPTTGNVIQSVAGAWASRTMAQLKTTLAIVVADISDFVSAVASAITAERTAVAALTHKDLTDGTNTFPTLNQNTTGSAAKWTTARTVAITGDMAYTSGSLDGTGNVTGAGTLATVNANVGAFGDATHVATFTVDGKGRTTAAAAVAIGGLAESAITGLVSDLAAKATDTAVVHKTGAETVAGVKTFSDAPVNTYQGSTPATPAAGNAAGPYFGADGLPYFLTPAGVVVPFSIGDVGTALHSNASFETVSGATPTVWDTFIGTGTFVTETSDVLFGTRSATVATAAGSNFQSLLSDTFTVAGGDTVSLGAWAHKITGSPKMAIGVLTLPSGTPAFLDGVSTGQGSDFFALPTTFTKYSKTFLVPAGHTVARMYVWFAPTASEATSSRVDFTTSSRTGASTSILPGNSWPKEVARCLTQATFAPTSAAPATVDGVSLAVGDRVLKATTAHATTDGLWAVVTVGSGANGVWARTSDASTPAQLAGAQVAVTSGPVFGGTRWATSFKATDTLGTTPMAWAPVVSGGDTADLTLGAGSVGSGTFRDSVDARVAAIAVAHCHVGYRSTAVNQTLTSGALTTLDLAGTADHDIGSGFSKTSNVVTITNAGVYQLHGFCSFNVATGNCRNILRIETWTGSDPGVGLATIIADDDRFANTTAFNGLNCWTQKTLAAGQKVRLLGFQNQGTNNTTQGATAGLAHQLNISRVS